MPIIPFNCATGEATPVNLTVAPTVALAPPDDSVDSNSVIITGTGVISSFGMGVVGVPITKTVSFKPTGGSITIKESATLDVLGSADHVINNPAIAEYRWDGVSKWTELSYADASVPGGGYLPLTGGTLTGNLGISPISGAAYLLANGAAGAGIIISGTSGNERFIVGQTASKNRWVVDVGTNTAESGSNVGSDLSIARFDDTGAFIDSPLQITRSNGVTTVTNLVDNGNLTVNGAVNCATYWNNPTFTGSVAVNGQLSVGGAVTTSSSLTINGQFYNQGGNAYLGQTYFCYPTIGAWVNYYSSPWQICQFQASWYWRWSNASGQLDWVGNGAVQFSIDPNGVVTCQKATTIGGQLQANTHIYQVTSGSRQWLYGQSGSYSDGNYYMLGDSADPPANVWKYYFAKATGQRNWVASDGTNRFQISAAGACICPGGFATGSDANMKRDIEPATLPELGMAALRKITPSYFHRIISEPDEGMKRVPDRREFGFIAQDVQAALPDAVVLNTYSTPYIPEGETNPEKMETKDYSHLAIETMPMLAALTNAIKELDQRLAAIEAKLA